jgi:hypothetical protein
MPKAIRVDNGDPWATRSDLPSALALWLIGLGVKVILNRPHHSTDNGIVERDHGVLAGWVEPQRASNRAEFQMQLQAAMQMQRERYPALQGLSRLQACPDLLHNPRPYRPELEGQLWSWERVVIWLSQRVWRRRVDKVGRISWFSAAYSVGRAYAGQDVLLHFDPAQQDWVIESEAGKGLKRYPNLDITPERIFAFALSKRANKVSHHVG